MHAYRETAEVAVGFLLLVKPLRMGEQITLDYGDAAILRPRTDANAAVRTTDRQHAKDGRIITGDNTRHAHLH